MIEFEVIVSDVDNGELHLEIGPYDLCELVTHQGEWLIGGITVDVNQESIRSLGDLYRACRTGDDCEMVAKMWVDYEGVCSLSSTTTRRPSNGNA